MGDASSWCSCDHQVALDICKQSRDEGERMRCEGWVEARKQRRLVFQGSKFRQAKGSPWRCPRCYEVHASWRRWCPELKQESSWKRGGKKKAEPKKYTYPVIKKDEHPKTSVAAAGGCKNLPAIPKHKACQNACLA